VRPVRSGVVVVVVVVVFAHLRSSFAVTTLRRPPQRPPGASVGHAYGDGVLKPSCGVPR
jgi:hypothetical protein